MEVAVKRLRLGRVSGGLADIYTHTGPALTKIEEISLLLLIEEDNDEVEINIDIMHK
jgi:hypothetical protein